MRFVATVDGAAQPVEVTGGDGRYRLTIGGEVWDVDARLTAQGITSLLIGGVSYVAHVADRDGACYVIRTRGGAAGGHGGQVLRSPMPGRITQVVVQPGDRVNPGDTLLVIEAMKMQNEVKAAAEGVVAEVRVQVGQEVNAGEVLMTLETHG